MRLSAVRLTAVRLLAVAVLALAMVAGLVTGPLAGFGRAAPPTPDDIRRQQEKASTLEDLASRQLQGARTAEERLQVLSVAASGALEALAEARTAARAASAEAKAASLAAGTAAAEQAAEEKRLAEARRVAETERRNLGRYVAATYRSGGKAGDFAAAAGILGSDDITSFSRSMADLRWAGVQKGYVVERVEASRTEAAKAVSAAEDAAERAQAAQQKAEQARARAITAEQRSRAARAEADQLVASQRTLVSDLEARARGTRTAAQEAATEARRMQKALAVAEQRRKEAEKRRREALARKEVVQVQLPPAAAAPAGGGGGATTSGSGGSCGGSTAGYANGQIPVSALCSLWGAEWHVLRGDAADAFNAMSRAYAGAFGRPICVTDSYRSYAMQVDVNQRKPDITAVPGTSNHGWGTAVDLCDGVNSYTSATHAWMRQNAPSYGWFLPSWAQQGGSRPEPWHWEFSG